MNKLHKGLLYLVPACSIFTWFISMMISKSWLETSIVVALVILMLVCAVLSLENIGTWVDERNNHEL